MRKRSAALWTLATLATWLVGCQVIAPLPGVGGEGGDPTTEGAGGAVDADEGEASQGSEITPDPTPPASENSGPCEIAECSTHCARSMDLCELTPQYPSVETCCAVCEAMPSPAAYAACRAVETGDPAGCTASGLLGPPGGDGCIGQCEAICTLYAALCPDMPPDLESCVSMCSPWSMPDVFDACSSFQAEGSFACRLQQIYLALDETDVVERDQACRDIVQGRCPKPDCEIGDD
ncbi:hypothetical protein WME89_38925 [Sorangium sp. So ce321]|uniref:hypothetical protein n=1 Tax=Sorangium sp. So ce321 TaxID=3133300 RepID=UPI003F6250B7